LSNEFQVRVPLRSPLSFIEKLGENSRQGGMALGRDTLVRSGLLEKPREDFSQKLPAAGLTSQVHDISRQRTQKARDHQRPQPPTKVSLAQQLTLFL